MKKPEFSEMTALDYINNFGIKNALANLTPFYNEDLIFIVPQDLLADLERELIRVCQPQGKNHVSN